MRTSDHDGYGGSGGGFVSDDDDDVDAVEAHTAHHVLHHKQAFAIDADSLLHIAERRADERRHNCHVSTIPCCKGCGGCSR